MMKRNLLKRINKYCLLYALVLGLVLAPPLWPFARIPMHAGGQPGRAADHILVKFKSGASAARRGAVLAQFKLSLGKEIIPLGVNIVSIPASKTPEQAITELKAQYGADIEYVEMDRILYAVKIPNDPIYPFQYHLPLINAPTAWDTTTGAGITIAIADTGVDITHPDLSAHLTVAHNVLDGSSNVTDNIGHGTAVAGAAAAVGDNGVGITGAAYNATILPIKISDDGSTNESFIATAITYAADHGAKVVNVSFNSSAGCWSQTVLGAADYMNSKGGLVVIAAGNDGIDKGCSNNPDIIDVGATDSNNLNAVFSNFGAEVDVTAPGVGIIMTGVGGVYVIGDGTSFAAPITAGVVALIYAIDPSLTAAQVQQILFDSAKDLGTPGYDIHYGWGRVDAANAISLAEQRSVTFRLNALSNVYAYPNPWDIRKNNSRLITFANLPDTATLKIFTLSGFWVKTLQPANGRATWDLTSDAGDRVASGLYFYLATNGDTKVRGTIAVIK
jgi:thermitase